MSASKTVVKKSNETFKLIFAALAIVIAIIILLTTGIVDLAQFSKPVQKDELEPIDCNGYELNECYSAAASYKQDAKYCNDVVDRGMRDLCIINVALAKNDMAVCDSLEKRDATLCRTLF